MPDRYVLGEQARADLDSIIVYVAEQSGSVETAFRVDEKLHDAFQFLAKNPRAGHTRTDIMIPDKFRVWSVYSYPSLRSLQVVQLSQLIHGTS